MDEIQRYDCVATGYAYCQGCNMMIKQSEGDYIRYEDHATALATERARYAELVAALKDGNDFPDKSKLVYSDVSRARIIRILAALGPQS